MAGLSCVSHIMQAAGWMDGNLKLVVERYLEELGVGLRTLWRSEVEFSLIVHISTLSPRQVCLKKEVNPFLHQLTFL